MRRGTTPTLFIRLPDPLEGYEIEVDLESNGELLEFTGDRVKYFDPYTRYVRLTQGETLRLKSRGRLQVRAIDADGNAVASSIHTFAVDELLNNKVVSYG